MSKPTEPEMRQTHSPAVPKHLYDDALAELKRAKVSIGGLQDQIANLQLELNTAKARLGGLERKRPGPSTWGDVTEDGFMVGENPNDRR